MRDAFDDRAHSASAFHIPRQNRLLGALPRKDYERLLPDLEPFPLPLGWAVHRAGERERYLYFLTAGIVSPFYVTESGASAEFALTGNEGVIGIASFLGGESTLEQRFCRWILSCLDRSPTNELALTQGLIAEMLGVRRGGVSEAAGRLRNWD